MIDCEKCVHYELCLDFVCSKQDMERDTDCDYFEEERPQGEWIFHTDDLYPAESTQECSVCHSEQKMLGLYDDNFCPNCGADMRKGGDGE